MSRYAINRVEHIAYGEEFGGVYGYDQMLETWFLQAFPNEGEDDSLIWLGRSWQEYKSLDELLDQFHMITISYELDEDDLIEAQQEDRVNLTIK